MEQNRKFCLIEFKSGGDKSDAVRQMNKSFLPFMLLLTTAGMNSGISSIFTAWPLNLSNGHL